MSEDRILIERCLNGDYEVFGKLIEKYQNMVQCTAFSILENFHDAEDAVQETFIKAYLNLSGLSNPDKFSKWLYKIARNTSYDSLRKRPKQVIPLSDLSLEEVNEMSMQRHRSNEISMTLREALDTIPEKQRTSLLLSLAGYSYQEVSDFLDVPKSTVRGRIARSKKSLKKEILTDLSHEVDAHKLDREFAQGIMAKINELPKPTSKSKPIPRGIVPVAIIGLLATFYVVLKMFFFAPETEQKAPMSPQYGITHSQIRHEWTRTLLSEWTSKGERVIYNPNDGYVYMTGFFSKTVDFDPTEGTENRTSAGWTDWCIWKLDSSGYYGNDGWLLTDGNPEGHDIAYDIVFDSKSNFYVTTSWEDTEVCCPNVAIRKYSQDRQLKWSYLNDGGNSNPLSLALSPDGKEIFVTGCFRESVDFYSDGKNGVNIVEYHDENGRNRTDSNWINGLLSFCKDKLSVPLNSEFYIAGLGETALYYPYAVFSGYNQSRQIQSTHTLGNRDITDVLTSVGSWDVFVMKLGADGTYHWTKQFGGTDKEIGCSICLDSKSNVYVSGTFNGTVDFDPGPEVDYHISNGLRDIFVTKLNSQGNYVWTKTFGGTGHDIFGNENSNGMLVTDDMIYLVGWFQNKVDFDPGPGVDIRVSKSQWDACILSLDLNGNYNWVKTLGGSQLTRCHAMAITMCNNELYVTGSFASGMVDFDPGPGLDVHTSGGIFISKYDSDKNYLWTETITGASVSTGWIEARSIAVDDNGGIYVTGNFNHTIDFDPSSETDTKVSSALDHSTFLVKFSQK